MEEDNKITPWKFIIKHWILILLVFLFPILINALTFIPNSQVFDKPNSWTEVWAEYGGALLSAGIALVILYKQQKQNHEENEANRKQNELQNKLNLNLQINALKYQQQYNWYFELKHALSGLKIACDTNIIKKIIKEIYDYYGLTDKNEIDKAKSEIFEHIYNSFSKIKSCRSSLFSLLNKEDKKDLHSYLEILRKHNYYFYNILNNLLYIIEFIDCPLRKNMSIENFRSKINERLDLQKTQFEELDEYEKLAKRIIYKKYLEKYNYDFYSNSWDILNSIYDDFENNIKSMNKIIAEILQYERNKIDKLLDVEEIKKNLNAN